MFDEGDADGIYLFGGTKYLNSSTPLPLTYGDVWRYDVGDNTWTELTPNLSNCPTPPAPCVPRARLGMAGAMHEGRIYIFGGLEVNLQPVLSFASRGDTWSFDVATQTWTQLFPTGDVPSPRHFVASSNYGQNKMVTYAGQTSPGPDVVNYGGVYTFDFEANSWQRIVDDSSRHQGSAMVGVRHNTLVVHAGEEGIPNTGVFTDVAEETLIIDLTTGNVQIVDFDPQTSTTEYKRGSAVMFGVKMYTFGGWNYPAPNPPPCDSDANCEANFIRNQETRTFKVPD